jgi:DNA processing protein
MLATLPLNPLFSNAISPFTEIVAYEALWQNDKASFKTISELFAQHPGSKPSDLVSAERIEELSGRMRDFIYKNRLNYKTNILINGSYDYPEKLKDAKEPIELLYYSGNLDYLSTRSVAIVGTRNPSPEGIKRAAKMVKLLVKDNFTIASGLAMGIDTQAHTTAINEGGRTIAVIGTPLNEVYPKTNEQLQKLIAKDHLLISQVPFLRYSNQGINGNRLFFPERNKTMSAITEATVIIEAGETSGTLVQAKAALQQGRHLFILESCFQNKAITWPEKFEKQGAIRVKEYEDIQRVLLK